MANLSVPVHIIYASTGGNTEHVMEQIAKYWTKQGTKVEFHRAEQTSISVFKENQFFLLATSTWDHGTINPFFNKLFSEMQKTDFSGKVASFIGLGDRRYEKHYFCTGMTALKELWEKNNGTAIGVALMIGREPFEERIEIMVKKWADETLPLYLESKDVKQANDQSAAPAVESKTLKEIAE